MSLSNGIIKSDFTHDGAEFVRSIPYGTNREPFRVGYRLAIVPDSQNVYDLLVDPATMVGADGIVQLMGGRIRVPEDADPNDYIEAVVVDKTGVIPDVVDGQHTSLMAHYGLPTDGSTFLEVSDKILRQMCVPVGDPAGQGFNPGGNSQVYGGLYLRMIYRAFKTTAYSGPLRLDINLAK